MAGVAHADGLVSAVNWCVFGCVGLTGDSRCVTDMHAAMQAGTWWGIKTARTTRPL